MMWQLQEKHPIIVESKLNKKMNKLSLSIVLSVFVLITNAQNVLQIEGKNVSLEEFKNIFYKKFNRLEIE